MPWAIGQPLLSLRDALAPHMGQPFRNGTLNLITILLVLLIGSLLINFGTQVVQSSRLESQRLALVAQVGQMQQDNLQLQGLVEYAESDANVERMAREQLAMARDGDVVILPQMQAPEERPAAASPSPLPTAPEVPNWRRWWDAFAPPTTP
ncbi:MAG: septum formation initiator family protein [Chloroflexaceae bacterium]|jgi:cell division protein FtsB|nr:septum formation initiator family protein [Chloroflexaceae bacterium]